MSTTSTASGARKAGTDDSADSADSAASDRGGPGGHQAPAVQARSDDREHTPGAARAPADPTTGVRTRFSFGAKPTIGAAAAVKAVVQDTQALVKAEIDLAKAELVGGIKANAIGVGLLVGAGVLLWLAVQGLLIAAGFALALIMPGWAAALIVSGVLILIAATLALVARNKVGTAVSVDRAKNNLGEDVQWFKTHLRGR